MMTNEITSILEQEANAVRNIPITPGYETAVNLIVHYVHELGGKLITSGMGKAGQIARISLPHSARPARLPLFCIPVKHNMATWVLFVKMTSCC